MAAHSSAARSFPTLPSVMLNSKVIALTPTDDQLVELLSMRRGHFRFVSGHHGELWLDLDQLFQQPAALRPFVDALAVRVARHRIDAVCGALVGGALLAQSIAATLET